MIIKLSFNYLIKNFKRSLILVICIASVCSFVASKSLVEKNSTYNKMLEVHSLYAGYDAKFYGANIDNIKNMENIDGVKKLIYTYELGNITYKNGVDISLCNYSDEYYRLNRFKLLEGRLPQNENEIAIEKRALKEIDKNFKLKQEIDFSKIVKNKSNSQYDISSKNIKYKLVGVIDRNQKYYENEYKLTGFTRSHNSKSYDGFLVFAQNADKRSIYEQIRQKSGLNDENLRYNEQLSMAQGEYKEAMQFSNFKEVLMVLIISLLLILNIFNIFTSSFIKEIGELKILGASKRDLIKLFLIQFTSIWLCGYLLGIISATLLSKLIVENYIFKNFVNARFIFSLVDVIYPLIITFFIVMLSSLSTIFIGSRKSGLECINENYKRKAYISISTKNLYIKNFINMFLRNISNILIVLISFSILGGMYFETTFRMTNNFNVIDMQQNNLFINDMILSPNLIDTNIGLSSLSKDDFDSVKISGKYTMVNYKKEIPYSYISLDRGQITKDYYTAQNFSGETLDMPITLKAYSQNMYSSINKYLEKGSIEKINDERGDYIPALISDKYYDMNSGENRKVFSNPVKLNNIYKIKLFSIVNGQVKRYDKKIKVVGLINEDWLFKGNSNFGYNPEVIISSKHIDKLGMENRYSQIGLINEKGYSEQNRKILDKKYSSDRYTVFDINSYTKRNKVNENVYLKEKLSQIGILLVLTMINLILMIRSNIIKRADEFAIMRALGMTLKEKYKWIILDNLIIALVAIIINIISAVFIYYNNSSKLNQLYMDIYSKALFIFNIPFKEMSIYILVVFISMVLGILLSKNNINTNADVLK